MLTESQALQEIPGLGRLDAGCGVSEWVEKFRRWLDGGVTRDSHHSRGTEEAVKKSIEEWVRLLAAEKYDMPILGKWCGLTATFFVKKQVEGAVLILQDFRVM